MITQTDYIEDVIKMFDKQIEYMKTNGIDNEKFEISKRKVYGEFVKEFNDVSEISTILVSDFFKEISVFEYLQEFSSITKEFVEEVLKKSFIEEMKVISIIKPFEE